LEDAVSELPPPMRQSLFTLWGLYTRLGVDYEVLDSLLKELAAQDHDCQNMMKLEVVGLINAIKLKIQLGHGEHSKVVERLPFVSDPHLSSIVAVAKSSWAQSLRSMLFLGARSVASNIKNREAETEKERWLKALVERPSVNCAAMVLANNTIRTAYAFLKNNSDYKMLAIAA